MEPDYGLIVQEIRKALGDRVAAVVLYGSRVHGIGFTGEQDIDLLVVASHIPESRIERKRIGLALHGVSEHMWRVSPVLMTIEEVRANIEDGNPLMFGLCEGYRMLYGNLPELDAFCAYVAENFEYRREWRTWISKKPT